MSRRPPTSSSPTTPPPARHFIFNDEHEQLRESIRSFAIKELAPHAEEWEETTFPDWVFPRMGELGFLGLSYPEEYGGQGGDYYANLVLAEEIVHSESRRPGDGHRRAHRHGHAAGAPVRHRGAEAGLPRAVDQGREDLLPGDHRARRRAPTSPGIKTRAVRDGDEYVINGSKTYITNGHRADFIVLVTKTDPDAGYDGFTLFLVDMDLPGVIREKKLVKLGMHASDTALLAFQDVRVPESAVLGQVGKGFYHIMWELQGERLIGAAGCVAGAQRVFDKTLQYAQERSAFGRPIGKFQVTRHKFAEMATKIESARQMVYTTAWRFANGEYPVREISMAKLHASRIAVEVADECIQIHGGAGYMKEYGIERVWRDMRLNRIGAGTDEVMLDVIGRSYGL